MDSGISLPGSCQRNRRSERRGSSSFQKTVLILSWCRAVQNLRLVDLRTHCAMSTHIARPPRTKPKTRDCLLVIAQRNSTAGRHSKSSSAIMHSRSTSSVPIGPPGTVAFAQLTRSPRLADQPDIRRRPYRGGWPASSEVGLHHARASHCTADSLASWPWTPSPARRFRTPQSDLDMRTSTCTCPTISAHAVDMSLRRKGPVSYYH
jgi:hypothetical protein